MKGLPGKTVITPEIRRQLKLDGRIIRINAKLWADVISLVDDYFLNHELDYQDNAKNVYDNILLVFSKISTYDEPEGSKCVVSKPLREYCTSVHNFLNQNQICNQFLRYYDLKEIESRKRIQELYKEKEGEVTEEIMERRSIIRIGKRAQCVSTHTRIKYVDIIISIIHFNSFKLNCRTLTPIEKLVLWMIQSSNCHIDF